jgi:hypothetical protein
MLPSIENKMNRSPLKIVDDFNYFSGVTDHKKKQKFISNLRFVSPLSAKIQAAKSMSYREGFGPYASKSTPTFRDVRKVFFLTQFQFSFFFKFSSLST